MVETNGQLETAVSMPDNEAASEGVCLPLPFQTAWSLQK